MFNSLLMILSNTENQTALALQDIISHNQYYQEFLEFLETNPYEIYYKKQGIHSKRHIDRVLFLAMLICFRSGCVIPVNELLLGIAYHDVGRINEMEEQEHGSLSAMKFAELHCNLDNLVSCRVQYIIEAHVVTIEEQKAFAEKNGVSFGSTAYLAAQILRDADILDRARFLVYYKINLDSYRKVIDPGQLFFSFSNDYISTAYDLVSIYR